jgi:hypothetical protein
VESTGLTDKQTTVRASILSRWLVIASALVTISFLSSVVLLSQGKVFQSPDETANRIFTETFANSGALWYENNLLQLDAENLLHPRGVLTHDGRAVPFNFLGVPVIYGAISTVVGDQIKYIAILFAIITVFALCKGAGELFGCRAEDSLAVIAGCTPLLYYFNRPFMNALPAITFFSLGIWLLVRYVKRSSTRSLICASVALSAAMFFRYEYALFGAAIVGVAVLQRHDAILAKVALHDLAIAATVVAAIFLIPVLVLNQYVYGSWSTYGYGLFQHAYYPSEDSHAPVLIRGLGGVTSILVPSTPHVGTIARNLLRFTLLLVPVLSILSLTAGVNIVRGRQVRIRTLGLSVLIMLYFVSYRGASDTWAAGGFRPNFDAAIVRYWLPMYLAMFFLAAFAMHTVNDRFLKGMLVALMMACSVVTLGWRYDGNLMAIRETLSREQAWSEDVLSHATEEDAIVYSGRADKRVVPFRYSAAWWNGEEFYDPVLVARSMARVHAAGYRVYVVQEREVDLEQLNNELSKYGLVAIQAKRGRIFAIHPIERLESATPR